MSSTSSPGRGRPARLDRSGTVDTALELLDSLGLDDLTMRRLADSLGVRAGALYRHFATKRDLLTAMAERMLADIPAPRADGDWEDRLAGLARAMRTALLAHRDGARVYAGTHSTGAHTLRFSDTVTGVLREAGFADEDAARALMAVANFTVGHTLEEQAALRFGDEGTADPEPLRQAVESGTFHHLVAALPTLTSTDFTAHFEFGLRLLVHGLRTLRESGTQRDPGGV
ncbi:TetR/AcrR family transcriptional regulator [Streptomyces sp. S465]|uniref:TetR/AcrR family transcriptional regulator n=1 Tax=Streptomyces sp. S465 TaxID=2979468 RepID=UPI0022A8A216|nr:TetR/AcrR family transcriptional regulator [Streptomyces sp. S465]WAP53745.1 TetR/AcrR family transcriptional regulator [Streptomyces sp. S465]